MAPVLERVARMLAVLAREKNVTLTYEAAEDAVAASAVDSVEAAVAAEEDSPAVAAAEDKHLKYLEIQKCQ